jgi:hypothetical protein
VGRGSARPRPTPPALTLLQGSGGAGLPPARAASWARLWPAWRNFGEWEERIDSQFGEDLGDDMLVLWALLRFGGSADLEALLGELVTDDLMPTFGGTLVRDIVRVAFALGAAWSGSEAPVEPPGERPAVAPHVVR